MDSLPIGLWIVVASELVAAWVIWRLWRSNDHVFFKVSLSLIALIPVLGPVIALWAGNFPERGAPILRVPVGRGFFFDRWRHVLHGRSPALRFRYWLQLVTKHRHEDP